MKRRRLHPQVRAKTEQALAAMQQILPLDQTFIAQTLDNLLQECNYDWEMVELDNYQVFADRILEAMDHGNYQAPTIANPRDDRPNGNHIWIEDNEEEIHVNVSNSSVTGLGKMKHNLHDIARGMENFLIPCEGSAIDLPNFYYIAKNVVYQDAYVYFTHARIGETNCCPNCSNDCTEETHGCACAETGEYAYENGCLKSSFIERTIARQRSWDDPQYKTFCSGICPTERGKNEEHPDKCKGHLLRIFVKECWNKCGCSNNCGNRIVQRGIRYQLQVFWTPEGKGWGLRALVDLPRGAFVCEYVGEILTNSELYERNTKQVGKHTYPVLLEGDWASECNLNDNEALCLDATFYGNVARFINHRCYEANLIDVPVEIESPDRHYYHVAFFTSRSVKALEELTWDYCLDFQDTMHPIKAFHCLCGSQYCRQRSSVATQSL